MAHLPNTSASASTSTAPSPKTNYNPHYDAIINHSGSDVENNFGSHLYHRLLDRGFKTLFERREMQQGDRLDSRTGAAIATASIHIPIFSPRYAESTCSLDELLLILKSKAAIIPVFYNVKPSDLRIRMGECQEQVPGQISAPLGDPVGNNGVYDEALRGHEKEGRCGQQTIADWKKALFDVSHFSGLELEACERDEGELVDRVVQRAEEEVAKPQFQVGKHVVGLDKKLEDLEKAVLSQPLQHKEGKVMTKFVGIVGVRGVGKTTLVTEFFKRKRSAYRRSCLLSDVREAAGRSSLHSLQNKLIKDFTSWDQNIVSVAEGKDKLSSSLKDFQGLVILDDLDDDQQMDALYSPLKDVLHPSSLILVTSRHKNVLKMSGMRQSNIYNLTGLDKEDSQELFCLHAFHKRLPVFKFKEVVPKFLDVCGGLPLCLKVLGALVYQKDLKYWKTPLRKISQGASTDIQGMLKIGYDCLDDQEKEIFLDIACFLIREETDTVINIWEASGWVGRLNLQNLLNKCFVEIDSKGRVRMHHHLIELGRQLADKEPPSFYSRLWDPTENHFDNAWRNSIVRGFNMAEVRSGSSGNNPVQFNNSFVDMSRLQLLKAEGDCLESISTLLPHSDLLWLCWNRCPYTSLPPWIPTRNLRVLRVAGNKLETLWHHESEAPLNLRELIIDAANFQLPKSIGQLKHLEKIELRYVVETLPEEFFHLTSLKHLRMYKSGKLLMLPESFGNLTNLRDLDLTGCSALKRLPESFGNLKNLRDLHLSGCSQLQGLPNSLGSLTALQQFDLSRCWLRKLPDSLGNLTGLQQLDLWRCSELQALPDSLGNLTGLQHLDLSHCSELQTLPDSLGNLTGLQQLKLSSCSLLQALPDSLGNLTGLQQLKLSSCFLLQALPDSLGNLRGLQHLDLSYCNNLQALPDSLGNLTGLQQLDLWRCSELQALPDSLGNLTGLQHLDLSYCSELEPLPDSLGNLTGLQQLKLSSCSLLQALPDSLGNLTGLQQLKMSSCSLLQALPDSLENLTGLQHLDLFDCYELQALPDSLGNLTGLQQLKLSSCSLLQALPDSLGNLTGLEHLHLSYCYKLQALPDSLGNLTGLQHLHLSDCSELQALPDSLGNLTGLQHLDLSDCSELQALPDSFGNLTGLQHLDLSHCSELQALPDSLGNLTGLQHLHLSYCYKLQALPDSLGNLTGLQHLHLSDCYKLQALPDSLGNLTGLQQLKLSSCSLLQELPHSLGNLTGLEQLKLSSCSLLQELPHSLGNLTGLQQLDLSRCSELQALPDSLGKLTGLQHLDFSHCSQLQALPDSVWKLRVVRAARF